MGETTTIVRDAADVPGAVATDLATTVGALTNETAHHAAALAANAERFTDLEGKHEWMTTRLDNLERTASEVPTAAIADLRAELAAVKSELTTQLAALSDAMVPQATDDPQTTDPPAPQVNDADPPAKRPGGLRGVLHRLL